MIQLTSLTGTPFSISILFYFKYHVNKFHIFCRMPGNPDEPFYCSQQINIPPALPDILKQFTKAAIRTQPTDVLSWSAA